MDGIIEKEAGGLDRARALMGRSDKQLEDARRIVVEPWDGEENLEKLQAELAGLEQKELEKAMTSQAQIATGMRTALPSRSLPSALRDTMVAHIPTRTVMDFKRQPQSASKGTSRMDAMGPIEVE